METRTALALLVALAAGGGCASSNGEGEALSSPAGPQQPGATPTATASAGTRACGEQTAQLQAKYDELRSCDQDADCNYISGFYDVIPRSQAEGLIRLFDCKEVTPLMGIGNGDLVTRAIPELKSLQQAQAQACARTPETIICMAFSDIPVQPPPLCRGGKCQPAVLPIGGPQ